ncbi:MAG: diguanylate cyclase [Clostridiaceae bacterium]|nr:diguanylate cyclase [Clostridiaceae bacterium]
MVILSALLFATATVFIFMFLYSLVRYKNTLAVIFALTCLSIAVYISGYGMELLSKSYKWISFFLTFEYFAFCFLPPLWFVLAYRLYSEKKMPLVVVIALFSLSFVTLFLKATSEYSSLYYAGIELVRHGNYVLAHIIRGPFYYVSYIYFYLCLLAAASLCYLRWRMQHYSIKVQSFWLLLSSVPPLVMAVLYFFGVAPVGIDLIPFSLLFSAVTFYRVFFKYDFLQMNDYIMSYTFGQMREGIFVIDERSRIIDFNVAASSTFEWLNFNNKGTSILEFDEGKKIIDNSSDCFEETFVKHGVEKVFEFRVSNLMEKGKNVGKLYLFQDTTEQNMAIERLNYLATHDLLCNIYNRNKIFAEIDAALNNNKETGACVSLLMIDIDFFKQINDKYGHLSGDMVIKQTSQIIQGAADDAIVGRYGGEEFLVLLPTAQKHEAIKTAEEIRSCIEKAVFGEDDQKVKITISIGIATACGNNNTLEYLINKADKALYRAKNSGRNKAEAL